jgi:CRISPR-associated protein Csm3
MTTADNTTTPLKLIAKIKFHGQIEAMTGLHIGGSKSSLEIGGIDLNVIKTPNGVPFIPGSSLKGKLRSLLAKIEGSIDVDKDSESITEIFGSSGENTKKGHITRLIVRDANLNEKHFKDKFPADSSILETAFTDSKYENTIERKTGTAKHPRQLERVPAGAIFNFEMIYDVYDGKKEQHLADIRLAMKLLQLDYLGGQGSRGYGKIRFITLVEIENKSGIERWKIKEESQEEHIDIETLKNSYHANNPSKMP